MLLKSVRLRMFTWLYDFVVGHTGRGAMAEYLHWLSRPCTSAAICQVMEGNDGRSRETLSFLL